jgi:hypothetical protein
MGNPYGGCLGAMGENYTVDSSARVMAFRLVVVLLCGTLVGSLAPESGNVLAYYLKLPYASGHAFNPIFLVLGVAGVCLALFARFGKRG